MTVGGQEAVKEGENIVQRSIKRAVCLLNIIIMMFLVSANVYAASGSLEINYKIDGASFNLYHVATRQADGSLTATETFEKYQVNLNTSDFRDIAITLSGYVERDNITADASAITSRGKCTFQGLASGIYLVLGEDMVVDGTIHTPVPVLLELSGVEMSVDMKGEQTPADKPGVVSCTAEKIWCGAANHPQSVTVQLLKDGQIYDEITLNTENAWHYTWSGLSEKHTWQVVEKEVPAGYLVSVVQNGLAFQIINTIDTPVSPPSDDDTLLTVHKVWNDNNSTDRPESVTIQLLRNGQAYDEIELNAANQWTYTWNRLDADDDWNVVEAEIPEGYTVAYDTLGNIVHITNTKDTNSPSPSPSPSPSEPVDLTVRKVWAGDDGALAKRPNSAGVTLYNGSTAIETVWLGEWNNWTYSWQNLDGDGDWSVLEVSIPDGYTPSYSVDRDVVTITNTSTLIDAGQLNWPIPVLGGLGVLMLAFGIALMRKKKDNAAE